MNEPMSDHKNNSIDFARFIALRYVSVGRRSQLVSFMSLVSIFGLVLGITILITVLSVMNGFDREVRQNILGIVPHLTINTQERLGEQQWQDIESIISANEQVVATAPLIEVAGLIATKNYSKGVLVNGIDAQREQEISIISDFMVQGSLDALTQQRWGIVLGDTLAQRLGANLGDSVDLFSLQVSINPLTPLPNFRSFKLVGIYSVGTQELDSELVIVNLAAAKALYKIRPVFTSMRVRLDDALEADGFARQLSLQLPAEVTITSWTRVFGNIYENIKFSRTIVGLMLWLLIAVATFNLVVSLIMIVRDKTADIAILRTLGASAKTINRIFMWQGCMIGLIGTTLGVVFGVLASWQVSNFAKLIEHVFSIQILSAEVYPVDFLPSQLRLSDIVMVAAGVMLLSVLATIYPARRAAAVQPAQALRGD